MRQGALGWCRADEGGRERGGGRDEGRSLFRVGGSMSWGGRWVRVTSGHRQGSRDFAVLFPVLPRAG